MKLGTKLLAAPLLTAAVVLLTGQLNVFMMGRASDSALTSSKASLDEFKTIASAQQQVGQVHASVYRTVSIIGSLDEGKVKAFRADLAKQLDGVKRVAGAVADGPGADAELKASVAKLGQLVDKYKGQTDSSIEIAAGDPFSGTSSMQAAEETFVSLMTAMGATVARIEANSDAAVKAAQTSARNTNLVLSFIGLAVAGVAVWLSWLMQKRIADELAQAARVAQAVAQGDLSASTRSERGDEVGDLLRALGSMTGQLNQSIATVMASSESIRLASAEIATGNQDLSARTEQTASNLQRAASSTEQLTATVRQSADSARQANQLASSAAEVAARGGRVVAEVVSTMDQINGASRKINDIIGTIDGIAFQTNILALNAAVEAARAGEQGRGFAVVAAEVRSLAQRSAEAAKEIKGLIGDSVAKVDSGSRLVADAGQTMAEIVSSVQRVSDIIGEISAAASEQSAGIGQVNTAVTELDQMTQQNAALVEQSAAAAASLREQAQRLAQVVSAFRLDTALARPAIGAEPGMLRLA